ncbi:sialidase A (neuraminidase A) [Streptococcus pneumoniae]|nr:sialidase A (neuraminidase A) [Streptococcus pneumoniae]
MNRSVQERKCRYSIRKLSVGAVSMIVGAVVFGTSPVLAQEGASEQPLANETQLSGESSTLTDTEKSQPSSETELSGNKQEQERKDKQEEKIPRDYYARDLENVETVIEKEDVEEKDIELYTGKVEQLVHLRAGECLITFPEDLHQPKVRINDEPVKKVVFKVAIS